MAVRAVTDYRGTFVQDSITTLFFNLTTFDGDAQDPHSITVSITQDSSGDEVESGTPDKITKGFFIFDWEVPSTQAAGPYTVTWTYDAGSGNENEIQGIVVVENADPSNTLSLYRPVLSQVRHALEQMILCAQRIPIYHEQGIAMSNSKEFSFTFERWNQSTGVRIYRNDKLLGDDVEVDYFNGRVVFDDSITEYDVINVDYNFRWFSDDQLDRFISNGVHYINAFPPQTGHTIDSIVGTQPHLIVSVLYAAARDALRELLLCLSFQEPQQVFGGPEKAQQAFNNMEGLKKNYETDLKDMVEQKKYGPYVGLTRAIVTPEFTLPGGRSRWFRQLFKGGTL